MRVYPWKYPPVRVTLPCLVISPLHNDQSFPCRLAGMLQHRFCTAVSYSRIFRGSLGGMSVAAVASVGKIAFVSKLYSLVYRCICMMYHMIRDYTIICVYIYRVCTSISYCIHLVVFWCVLLCREILDYVATSTNLQKMELTVDLMDKYPDFASGCVTMGSLLLSQQVCQVLCPHEEVPAKNNEEYLKLYKKYTAALRVAVLCFWNESCNVWEPIAICSTQRLTWQWEDMNDLRHKSHTCSPLPPFNPTTSVNGTVSHVRSSSQQRCSQETCLEPGLLNWAIYLLLNLEGECTLETCPMSSKDEWIYHCNAHRKARESCAIEYITHTIDASTTALVIDRPPLRSKASALQSSFNVATLLMHFFTYAL